MPPASPTPSPLSALLSKAGAPREVAPQIPDQERERAFAELIRLVMISVRATMGRRLRDHRESADVCQSVARSFVDDFDRGRVTFRTEAELASYLQLAVRNRIADIARRDTAAKRAAPSPTTSLNSTDPIAPSPTASMHARGQELAQNLASNLTEEEQHLIRLRAQGLEWEAIPKLLSKDAAALRKQFSRAQERFRQSP